ncbi:MAG: radical SAM protein [Acidobacteria bacterium]|nr:radical SAM protein [Acidobacteriota bacterium]
MRCESAHRGAGRIRSRAGILPRITGAIGRLSGRLGDISGFCPPSVIKLYVTNRCNARCLMCDLGRRDESSTFYRQASVGTPEMPVSLCWRLAEEFASFRPRIQVCGVEPLLHGDIGGVIQEFATRGLETHLVTNGILLLARAPALARSGLTSLVVSLDGVGEMHDAVRGTGIYDQVIEGLRRFHEERRQDERGGPGVVVSFCITPLNQGEVVKLAERILTDKLAERLSVTHMYFVSEEAGQAHSRDYGHIGMSSRVNVGGVDPISMDVDALAHELSVLRRRFPSDRVTLTPRIATRESLAHYYRDPDRPMRGSRCLVPWFSSTILTDGSVVVHNRCFPYLTGNVTTAPFLTVWRGDRMKTFRRELRRVGLFPACYRCCGAFPPSYQDPGNGRSKRRWIR